MDYSNARVTPACARSGKSMNKHLIRFVSLLLIPALLTDSLHGIGLSFNSPPPRPIGNTLLDTEALHLRGTWFFHNPADSREVIDHRSEWIRRISLEQLPDDASRTGAEYGERLVREVNDPQQVFDAWLRHTEHYRAPSGSRVMTTENDPALDRIAAFYIGNLMLAFINQRKEQYGVG